ncbi:MAG TPA: hypothetical protein VKF36_24740 [Syntrophorhabdales bacterium]|nr:hypothetical protein [Syntrophorhabdales bacterium]
MGRLLRFLQKTPRTVLTSAAILVSIIVLADWRNPVNVYFGFLYVFPMLLVGTVLSCWQPCKKQPAGIRRRRPEENRSLGDSRTWDGVYKILRHRPGIASTEKLFEPLQKGADATGLGLFLSRAFMRSFWGDLRYEPGMPGCCFVIGLAIAGIAEVDHG